MESSAAPDAFARPYVISWNLTYRCNLACEHCYLDAGGKPAVDTPAFADRSELDTEACYRVVDQIAAFAPDGLLILTGGEPLLRRDIVEIIRYAAARDLWVVVGTNGVKITANLAAILKREGVRGLSLSLDALDEARHDAFRRVTGAFRNTVEGAKILAAEGLPFIVQTTVGSHNVAELAAIADFAYEELGARVWNLYFLVPTGRGAHVSDLDDAAYDRVLGELAVLQKKFAGRMLVNAKCAPHYVRILQAEDPSSPFIKGYAGGAGGCPAGTHYMGIRPNGDVTPCPYLPEFGGNLQTQSLGEIWRTSEIFLRMRDRPALAHHERLVRALEAGDASTARDALAADLVTAAAIIVRSGRPAWAPASRPARPAGAALGRRGPPRPPGPRGPARPGPPPAPPRWPHPPPMPQTAEG